MYKVAFLIIIGLSCLFVCLNHWIITSPKIRQTPKTLVTQTQISKTLVPQTQTSKTLVVPKMMYASANNGLANLKTALGYCRYNSNDPLYIKNCMNNIMYPPSQQRPTNAQIQGQIDIAFNKCKGNHEQL